MYTEILPSLQNDIWFKEIGRTHSTYSDSKWIIITAKASKDTTTVLINNLIEKSNDPTSNPNKRPGRSTKYNINSILLAYAAILHQNIEVTDNTKKYPPLGVQKRNFQISYNLTSTIDFPSSHKKKSKSSPRNSTNDSPCDQASKLSTLDTNADKFQLIMEANNRSTKSDIMDSFKSKLNETLTNNNNALSWKISSVLDKKIM